jgi:hypothetical protein
MAKVRFRKFMTDFSVGIFLGSLFPGLRTSNPTTEPYIIMARILINSIVAGVDPDEFELDQLFFAVFGYFFGLGGGATAQYLYNLIVKGKSEIPMNPRVFKGTAIVGKFLDDEYERNNNQFGNLLKELNFGSALEYIITGNKVVYPKLKSYNIDSFKAMQEERGIAGKLLTPIDHPKETTKKLIPGVNLLY